MPIERLARKTWPADRKRLIPLPPPSGGSVSKGKPLEGSRWAVRDQLPSMPEGNSQLPGLLTQRERAALRQPRNLGDRCLVPGMRLELANVFLRPEAPRPPFHLLCHRDSLQGGDASSSMTFALYK